MTPRPELPEVPDVVDFQDEPAREVLRRWASDYARACSGPSIMTPRCIITGCDIVYGNATQHGDLWELGDCYIFNAVGEPDYSGEALGDLSVSIYGDCHNNYFERRNVFVVKKSECHLSAAAVEHIMRGL